MGRQRTAILVVAALAVLIAMLVFRVRVVVAGGKLVVVLALIALAAWALWPRNEK